MVVNITNSVNFIVVTGLQIVTEYSANVLIQLDTLGMKSKPGENFLSAQCKDNRGVSLGIFACNIKRAILTASPFQCLENDIKTLAMLSLEMCQAISRTISLCMGSG